MITPPQLDNLWDIVHTVAAVEDSRGHIFSYFSMCIEVDVWCPVYHMHWKIPVGYCELID